MISSLYSVLAILRSNETVKCPLPCSSELSTGMAFKTHRYQNPTIIVTLLNFTVESIIPRGRLQQWENLCVFCSLKSLFFSTKQFTRSRIIIHLTESPQNYNQHFCQCSTGSDHYSTNVTHQHESIPGHSSTAFQLTPSCNFSPKPVAGKYLAGLWNISWKINPLLTFTINNNSPVWIRIWSDTTRLQS